MGRAFGALEPGRRHCAAASHRRHRAGCGIGLGDSRRRAAGRGRFGRRLELGARCSSAGALLGRAAGRSRRDPTTAARAARRRARMRPAPVVGARAGADRARTELRRRQAARGEVAVGVVRELARADRRRAGDQHQRLVGGQLQHLARRQQRPRRLLARTRSDATARARADGRQSSLWRAARWWCRARRRGACAVRSSLGAKATRTWQLSRMALFGP